MEKNPKELSSFATSIFADFVEESKKKKKIKRRNSIDTVGHAKKKKNKESVYISYKQYEKLFGNKVISLSIVEILSNILLYKSDCMLFVAISIFIFCLAH